MQRLLVATNQDQEMQRLLVATNQDQEMQGCWQLLTRIKVKVAGCLSANQDKECNGFWLLINRIEKAKLLVATNQGLECKVACFYQSG